MDFKNVFLGFYISSDPKDFVDEENVYDIMFHTEAFEKCFGRKLFVSEEEYFYHGSVQKTTIVFNVLKRKCYSIHPNDLEKFLLRYFPNKNKINKKPQCYFFLYPTISPEQNSYEHVSYRPIYFENYAEIKKDLAKYESYVNGLIKLQKLHNPNLFNGSSFQSGINFNKLFRPVYEYSEEEKLEYESFYRNAEINYRNDIESAKDLEEDRLRDEAFDGMVDEWNDIAYERRREYNADDDMIF